VVLSLTSRHFASFLDSYAFTNSTALVFENDLLRVRPHTAHRWEVARTACEAGQPFSSVRFLFPTWSVRGCTRCVKKMELRLFRGSIPAGVEERGAGD